MGHWAFSWVQVVAHNKALLLWVNIVLAITALVGLHKLEVMFTEPELGLFFIALVSMAALVGWFLESPKIAILQFLLSLFVILATLGIGSWVGLKVDNLTLLALIVVLTIVSSNLVHLLSTLAREMARGLFQFDAIAEALKLNVSPLFLSNLTTAAGFVVAALLQADLKDLAWFVAIGVSLSFLVMLTWLPLILLSWLLEFRVGNTSDRKGLNVIVQFLQRRKKWRLALISIMLLCSVLLVAFNSQHLLLFSELLFLLVLFSVLFWLAWRSVSLALLNTLTSLVAILLAVAISNILFNWLAWPAISAVLWLVPLGIIIDDGIHFFSRYARAQQTLFSDKHSAVVFAMASVGRPIWITSWTLLLGMLLLLLSNNALVVNAAVLTLIAISVTAVLILIVVPALIMTSSDSKS